MDLYVYIITMNVQYNIIQYNIPAMVYRPRYRNRHEKNLINITRFPYNDSYYGVYTENIK